ncbi:uncharacterized protein LOC135838705 [Planococcus citri]|uniref:uncharacterized protein LOC135838705 n=1 Tax=Planococcus citri TaxID=170843 RepID=UPI0031F84D11
MQITLREQMVKIIKQILGRENIFGYETTLANQLFLLYCFCGKIYFTRKITNSFRFIWTLFNLSGVLVGYVIAGAFLLHDKEPDISMQLFMITMMMNSTQIAVFIPLLTFLNRDNIEQYIRDIDRILQNRSSHQEKLNLRKYVYGNILIELIGGIVFSTTCLWDVLIFYEEEKVKNYSYYLCPFPNTELTGTKTSFLINTALSIFILSSQACTAWSTVSTLLIWSVICNAQLKKARKTLDHRSDFLSSFIEKTYRVYGVSRYAEKTFEKITIEGIRDIQQITRLIESLRKFYQVLCSSAIPVAIIGAILQLHIIVSVSAHQAYIH